MLMRTKQLFLLVLLIVLLPTQVIAQNHNYWGQHINIKLSSGDSIQGDLIKISDGTFHPIIKNGKIAWCFNGENQEDILFSDVERIDFRSFKFDSIEVRKALIEFYNAMDGKNWTHNDNWCSDKPISEWYGIRIYNRTPWPTELRLANNNLSGTIPDIFGRTGPIKGIFLSDNNLEGEIPASLWKNYSLQQLSLSNNKLLGTLSADMVQSPNFYSLNICNNLFEGPLPEDFILEVMNTDKIPGSAFGIYGNNWTGKVPMSIRNHPRFPLFWSKIILNTSLDISDLDIPAPVFKCLDISGNTIDLESIYKKNKYTLLYKWGWWCPWSELYNQRLIPACIGYQNKGLEVIGFHISREDELEEYLNDNEIPWRISPYSSWGEYDNSYDDQATLLWNWSATPQVYLVDNNGHIVFTGLMDENGKTPSNTQQQRNKLFDFLEDHLGKIDYQYYTSSDYSHDGETITLQTATEGQGIDLVFVGEGFVDKDYEEGGCFNQHMNDAMEQFFAYEPYTSLRNRFNVYAVKAVSPNAEFIEDSRHAIDENISTALQYASKVPTLKEDGPMRVAVVYKNMSGGRSYCNMFDDNSFVCFSMTGVDEVLNHEAGGHGVGRLLDEYVESGNESLTLPEEKKDWLEFNWSTYGWGANVDWRSDATEVKWSHFMNDTRYAEEQTGVYEGSYLYGHGAYRPTENSMMRYNDTPFNAPSREAIYKRVMQETEGETWNYDYETFVAFDAAGREQFANGIAHARQLSKKRGYKEPEVRTLPPVRIRGTWRDALKKKK